MKKISKPHQNHLPAISTASLPDIVFILLFFFMTVTTIQNQNLFVENTLPLADEVDKLDKTDRIIEVFVGAPLQTHIDQLGQGVRIQMEERFIDIDQIKSESLKAIAEMPEHLRKKAMVSLKADKGVKMGIVEDIKQKLREVNLLKINYTTVEGTAIDNSLIK